MYHPHVLQPQVIKASCPNVLTQGEKGGGSAAVLLRHPMKMRKLAVMESLC